MEDQIDAAADDITQNLGGKRTKKLSLRSRNHGSIKAGILNNHFLMDGGCDMVISNHFSMVKIWGSHHPIEATIYNENFQVPGAGPTFLNVMI